MPHNHDEFTPATPAELSRFVRENARAERRALYPVGGRTALGFGYPAETTGVVVSTAGLTRTIDYPARDMTVTVEAGVRMDQLAAMLKAEGQQSPIDVAQSHRATLGGVVATNTSGPRRFGYGRLRDYVIGVSAVDAGGRLFHAGGRVVKNVAGYDLCKLLVGSLGTLAIITELTLKLRPLPESTALVWASFDEFEDIDIVLERLLTSETRPVALDVLNPDAARQVAADARRELPCELPVLCVGLEGSERETNWQVETLQSELAPFGPRAMEVIDGTAAGLIWAALTEFQVCADAPLTFQANLLPSKTMEFLEHATALGVSAQAHAGNGIVIGHFPDEAATLARAGEMLSSLRSLANKGGGNVVVFDCEAAWKKELPLFGAAEPAWPLMRRVKETLDPENLLNPGRFVDSSQQSAVSDQLF